MPNSGAKRLMLDCLAIEEPPDLKVTVFHFSDKHCILLAVLPAQVDCCAAQLL
jgi:hypothetical protein